MDSIIRSCNNAAIWLCFSVDKSPLTSTKKATPRSSRNTSDTPLLWTISVALLDQGEIVPGRGVTKKKHSFDAAADVSSLTSNNALSVAKSSADKRTSVSIK